MIVIDASTGKRLVKGGGVMTAAGYVEVLDIVPGMLKAKALVRVDGGEPAWQQLVVRWTHPAFFMTHVGFLNT